MKKPNSFLCVRIHDLKSTPGLTALCAGYEQGKWRADALADHAFEWLPEFALNHRELKGLTQANAVPLLRRAAATIYKSEQSKARGEFGELLLHICLRQVFDTVPAISKIYYKDSANDVAKGFDAVHIVVSRSKLQLWLGEAKFYANASKAISAAKSSLVAHASKEFLRSEFALIINKIDPTWPHAEKLKKLLSPATSLDEVFESAHFPVLLTYDSHVVASHTVVVRAFEQAFETEIRGLHKLFSQGLATKTTIHLFFVPLNKKKELVDAMHKRLKAWQSM